jgi:hypothetical protein
LHDFVNRHHVLEGINDAGCDTVLPSDGTAIETQSPCGSHAQLRIWSIADEAADAALEALVL